MKVRVKDAGVGWGETLSAMVGEAHRGARSRLVGSGGRSWRELETMEGEGVYL